MRYTKLLFDLDGTISDPKEGICKSFQHALRHFGINVENLDDLEMVIGPPLRDSFQEFYGMSAEDAELGTTIYRERFGKVGLFENEIYPGMKPMLEKMVDNGATLAIASSKPMEYIHEILKYFEIEQCFTHVVGAYMDGRRGTKDEIVKDAIEMLGGEVEKDHMLMIGDRKFDMFGAHENGIRAVGCAFGYGGRKELEEENAEYVVDSVEELEALLLELL